MELIVLLLVAGRESNFHDLGSLKKWTFYHGPLWVAPARCIRSSLIRTDHVLDQSRAARHLPRNLIDLSDLLNMLGQFIPNKQVVMALDLLQTDR